MKLADLKFSVPSEWNLDDPFVLAGAAVGLAAGAIVAKSAVDMAWWRRRLRDAKTGEEPDGPKPRLVVGNVPLLTRGFFESLYEYIGSPSSVFWVMSTPFVVVTDPDAVRRVLGGDNGTYTKQKYFGYRSKTVSTAVASQKRAVEEESIDVDGDGDASRRALVKLAEDSFPTISAAAAGLLDELVALSTDDRANARPDAAMLTVQRHVARLNLRLLFQFEDERRADDVGVRILRAGREFAMQMVNPMRPLLHPWSALSFMLDAIAIVRFGRELGRHLDSLALENRSNWVHAWIGKVGKVAKLGKITGLLMASTQTVPMSALWTIHFASQHPEVMERLRTELCDKIGVQSAKDLKYEHLEKMEYVESVVRETLRMRPPFPVLVRQAQRRNELAGVVVPEGTAVYIVPWLVHNNPKSWKEPDKFNPDRFVGSPERGDAPSDFAFVPFARGARMCAGSRLALAELKTLLAHFVLGYRCKTDFPPKFRRDRFPNLNMEPRGIVVHMSPTGSAVQQ